MSEKLSLSELEEIFEGSEQDIDDEDYGFILTSDGRLKSAFFPESDPFATPENVAKILAIFGITDPSIFTHSTIH
jgi:hypothetical protein